jgi:hypothetical protein
MSGILLELRYEFDYCRLKSIRGENSDIGRARRIRVAQQKNKSGGQGGGNDIFHGFSLLLSLHVTAALPTELSGSTLRFIVRAILIYRKGDRAAQPQCRPLSALVRWY